MTAVDYSMLNSFDQSSKEFNCLGMLKVTSGSIAVGDPMVRNFQVLAEKIKPGIYPVISHFLPYNEVVFVQFSDKPAVRWENAKFVGGANYKWEDHESWTGKEFEGYEVDSGLGCFVDSANSESLGKILDENEWLVFEYSIQAGRTFFYADISDETFRAITEHLLQAERDLRRISGWQETLTGDSTERGRQRESLYKDFKSLGEYLEYFKNTNPENAEQIENLLADRDQLIAQLTEWTEQNGFGERMQSTRRLYDRLEMQLRQDFFSKFKHIVFNNDTRSNAFVFSSRGDGIYPSFFGFDENGEICVLITDFAGIGMPWEEDDEDGSA